MALKNVFSGAAARPWPRPHPRLPVGKQGRHNPGCPAGGRGQSPVYSPVRCAGHHPSSQLGQGGWNRPGGGQSLCLPPSLGAPGHRDGSSPGPSLREGPQQLAPTGRLLDPRAQGVAPLRSVCDRGAGPLARPGYAHVGLHSGTEVRLAWQSPSATVQGLAGGGGPGARDTVCQALGKDLGPTVRPLLC